jgi:methionyl-tRNA formyltransferase
MLAGDGERPDRLRAAAAAARGRPVDAGGRAARRDAAAGVDLIIAAHSHDFIGRPHAAQGKLGAIGYHPSLLPLHRGRDADPSGRSAWASA